MAKSNRIGTNSFNEDLNLLENFEKCYYKKCAEYETSPNRKL